MKFSVSSSELLKNLQIASGAIGSNPVLPILEDFLFVIKENTLTITASNLETTIINSMDVNSEKDGSVAVPAKILLDTLKALPDQPITFTMNEDNRAIELTSAFGKYKLAGEGPEDFPETPAEEEVNTIQLTTERRRALSHAVEYVYVRHALRRCRSDCHRVHAREWPRRPARRASSGLARHTAVRVLRGDSSWLR